MSDAHAVSQSPWWQWTLKELSVAIVYVAIFLAMMSYMGSQNALFWVCAIASSIILVVCLLCLPYGNAGIPSSFVTALMVLLCNPMLMFFSGVMAINGLLHFGLLWRAKARSGTWSVKQVLLRSTSLTLVAFAIGLSFGYPGYLEFASYKKQIQLTDLSGRLAYESIDPQADGQDSLLRKPQVTPEIKIPGESEFEDEAVASTRWRGRTGALHAIHSGRVEMFVKSPGFGIGRFMLPSIEYADFPMLQDLPFELLTEDEFQKLARHRWSSYHFWDKRAQDKESLHQMSVTNFVSPESWGFVIEAKKVFGFRPHGFTMPPQNMGQNFLEDSNLKLTSLQLISPHRFETPRAYVLDHLPRMDQLVSEDVPTRELTEFELVSIEQLADANTLVRLQSTPSDGLEMVGAIRAYESCLDCHSVRRGDMLGAFTYQFEETTSESTLAE